MFIIQSMPEISPFRYAPVEMTSGVELAKIQNSDKMSGFFEKFFKK